jgi:hypothetical protein
MDLKLPGEDHPKLDGASTSGLGCRTLRRLLVAIVVGAFAVVAAAPAQAQLPVGEADGVRIVRERGAIVVVFTRSADRLWRRVAGRRVSVYCTEFIEDGANSGGVTMRAPKRGRRIRTGDQTRGMDYCRVWLEERTVRRRGHRIQTGRRLIVSIPLTQKGAVYLDEQKKTGEMMQVIFGASILAERRGRTDWFTYDELLGALFKGRPAPPDFGVVALAGPTDTPPAGKVGYWSDGEQHVAVVTLSSSGRRLFVEYEGDVLHTNVASYIYGDVE